MTTALIYLLVMVLIAAVVYLLAATVFGRGEELAPLPPGTSPTRLPAADITGDDTRAVRFQQTVRGYKVAEVDWVLDRLASELDVLRARVYQLESMGTDTDVVGPMGDTAEVETAQVETAQVETASRAERAGEGADE